jgi:hypothetical protein
MPPYGVDTYVWLWEVLQSCRAPSGCDGQQLSPAAESTPTWWIRKDAPQLLLGQKAMLLLLLPLQVCCSVACMCCC